ncbi:MocR-like pyridoxine biosynthesis transcription factor PdxR [Mucilaginibacter pocheonensis]|uniref:GntR family transcriptional regulator/MocR family aminotransferase n=1 Tax=Mucilaginibacter pocheonensis TaxID=398050 RepID=A0ABU1TEU1_9SPHI|nr:PLP-dependent aminotransferase family protein [Mucilaginibacter pocheonensis]MDR6943774.1 GntR family transcriptional regulator/MocR family aminotransferase [Mucilaginibacter pocheonensis]
MLPYHSLIVFDEKTNRPVYRFIANRLISLIQHGTLLPGTFLPGTREMAVLLKLHRNTIIKAYNELIAQGWAEAIDRKGIQIIAELPIVKPRSFNPVKNFPVSEHHRNGEREVNADHRFIPITEKKPDIVVNDGFPDPSLAPVEEILKEYRKYMKPNVLKELLAIKQMGGNQELRASTAKFLSESRGLNILPENVLITHGAQMAIYIAALLLIKPGDEIVVSEPSYFIADELFRNLGAKVNRVPVDQDGIDIAALTEVLRSKDIKLMYIIPHHHHPTTVTMTASRRITLLNLIRTYNLWVIEDDYDYDFHYQNSPILPLASADHQGQIIYIGSFTKILAPSFRVGYMVAGADFVSKAINTRRFIDLGGDTVMEAAISSLIESGELSRHIKRSKKVYQNRCELVCKLLTKELPHMVTFTKPQGGMALWLQFASAYPLSVVLPILAQHGIQMIGSAYYKGVNKNYNHIRFGFASLSEDEMRKIVSCLKDIAPKT